MECTLMCCLSSTLWISVSGDLVERLLDCLPECLRPRLSVSAGHPYVTMSKDHLNTVQRNTCVQKSGGARIAQSVL